MKKLNFDTIAVTGGFLSDPATGATNVPLYLSNAYQFKSADYAANLFNLTEAGYIYTRLHNPTTDVLENRIAMLEGGTAAVATASGQFAEFLVFATLCSNGDEIIASSKLYGGTVNLLSKSLKRFGIKVIFADQSKPDEWENAVSSNTKALYLETVANPDSSIPDFEGISAIGKKYGIPVIMDNTMTSPFLFKPVEHGANIVVHSTTKYLAGNGTVMGGAVVDLGNFDWEKSGRFPDFCEPDESYHGVQFAQTFKTSALAVRMRVTLLRDLGGTPSPFNSFLTLLGLQTLHLRMQRHVENARKIVNFLMEHPQAYDVCYPELPSHPGHELCKKYFPSGPGSLLNFKVKGGYEAAKKFIESLKLCVHATNVGDARTIVTHSASTTHRQLNDEHLQQAGITKDFIRVSAGIEDPEDIINDIRSALDIAGK